MGPFCFNFVKCSLVSCVLLSLHGTALSKTVLRHRRCSVGDEIEIKEDLECKPRPQVVPVPKSQPHDVFSPTAVVVNRCSGGCPNMRGCTPKAVGGKCVLVEDKIQMAYEFREVEEHTECSCCDVTEDMCNEKQQFLAKECMCLCKDESEAKECREQNRVWDIINCNCMCPKKSLCLSTQKWSEETCRCEDKDKYRNYV